MDKLNLKNSLLKSANRELIFRPPRNDNEMRLNFGQNLVKEL